MDLYPEVSFEFKAEINYIEQVLRRSTSEQIAGMDFADVLEDQDQPRRKSGLDLESVTASMERRLAQYGSIDCMDKVAKKTGGNKSYQQGKDKHLDYYDQEDPFIDDGGQIAYKQLLIVKSKLEDYRCIEGGLPQLEEEYKSRRLNLKNLKRNCPDQWKAEQKKQKRSKEKGKANKTREDQKQEKVREGGPQERNEVDCVMVVECELQSNREKKTLNLFSRPADSKKSSQESSP